MTIIRKNIPPMFRRRDLVHLALLITALILLLSGIKRVQNPAAWEWLVGKEQDEARAANVGDAPNPASTQARSLRSTEATDPTTILSEKALVLKPKQERSTDTADSQKAAEQSSDNPLGLKQTEECGEVDQELLKPIQDKTETQPEDKQAIYQLACVAALKKDGELYAQSRKDLLFANLFHESEKYRGHLVHFQGVLARLSISEKKEFSNPYGIGTFYEAWIFPEDQRTNPIVFLFTKLPEGLKPGSSLKETVELDGYYLKLRAYRNSQQKLVSAPLLVGYTLAWNPRGPLRFGTETTLTLVGIVGVLIIGWSIFRWTSRKDRRLADSVRKSGGSDELPAFLNDAPSTTAPPSADPFS